MWLHKYSSHKGRRRRGSGVQGHCHCWMSLMSRSCMLSRVCSKVENCFSRWFAMCSLASMVSLVLARCSFILKMDDSRKLTSENFLTHLHTQTALPETENHFKIPWVSKSNEFVLSHLTGREKAVSWMLMLYNCFSARASSQPDVLTDDCWKTLEMTQLLVWTVFPRCLLWRSVSVMFGPNK